MMENVIALVETLTADKLGSKLNGRRNWVVMTRGNVVKIAPWGEAVRCGWMEMRLSEIAAVGVRWFKYTYKADALEAYKVLREAGYEADIMQKMYMEV